MTGKFNVNKKKNLLQRNEILSVKNGETIPDKETQEIKQNSEMAGGENK